MPALTADPELVDEIAAMEAEVRRCKAILTGILVSAGEARGESAALTTLHIFLDDLVDDWRDARAATTLTYDNTVADDLPIVSDTALKQVVFNLLDNAFEASPPLVRIAASREGAMLVLAVSDDGPGFAAGDPGAGRQALRLQQRAARRRSGPVSRLQRGAQARRPRRGRQPPGRGASVTLSLPLAALGDRRRSAACRLNASSWSSTTTRPFAKTLKRSFERRGYEVRDGPRSMRCRRCCASARPATPSST